MWVLTFRYQKNPGLSRISKNSSNPVFKMYLRMYARPMFHSSNDNQYTHQAMVCYKRKEFGVRRPVLSPLFPLLA